MQQWYENTHLKTQPDNDNAENADKNQRDAHGDGCQGNFQICLLIFHSVQAPRRPNKSSCTVSQPVLAGDYLPGLVCGSLAALDAPQWADLITFTSAGNFDSSCTKPIR